MGKDIILCQITSKPNKYSILVKGSELRIDSFIRCNMIFTAATDQIKRKLGKISNRKYAEVVKRIAWIIS